VSQNEVLYDAEQHGELLTPEAAIAYLNKKHSIKLGAQRMADMRSIGGGPRFIKPTQREVRYPTALLDEWAAARNRKPILTFVPLKPGVKFPESAKPADSAPGSRPFAP
jgi:hypothetical protein